jgi:hypothetical protein
MDVESRTTDMKFAKATLTDDFTIHGSTDEQAKERSPNYLRGWVSPLATRNTVIRAYLRDLRAAEMTAWELTGGDFLISR